MNPILTLEISAGVGFVLMSVLAISLTVILVSRVRQRGYDYVAQLTIAMILMKAGVGTMLGYRWSLSHCRNTIGDNCSNIEDDFWIYTLATVMMSIAGLMLLRILSRPSWRPWSWLGAGTVAIFVSFSYYILNFFFR